MAKCPKCEMGRLDPAGNCKYCTSMQNKVQAGRTDMKGPLKRFQLITVGVIGGAYIFRAVVYLLNYSVLTDLLNGDASALDRYNSLSNVNQLLAFIVIGSYIIQNQAYLRWLRAANANALSRQDVGLRWIKAVPSAKEFWAWRRAWLVSIWITVILTFTLRGGTTDLDRVRTWLLVEIVANVGLVVVVVFYALSARKVTGQLLTWLDAPPAQPVPQPVPPIGAVVPAQAPAPAFETVPAFEAVPAPEAVLVAEAVPAADTVPVPEPAAAAEPEAAV